MNFKFYYDKRHQSQFFRKDDFILLRFHREYDIFTTTLIKKKYDLQFISSFKVFDKIKRFVYYLNILII